MLVRVRHVEQQRVLTLTRTVRVGELDAFIDTSDALLTSLAAPAGPLFVVYHGEVTTTLASPVEVCLPIAPDASPTPDQTLLDQGVINGGVINGGVINGGVVDRVEPAHREAFVPVTKAGLEFPEILDAYATVERWIATAGVHCTGSPREVYFGIFDQASMDDEVCEVAFPISD